MAKRDTTDKKLILYVGSDFSTLLTLNKLIPGLVSMGITPVMIFPTAPQSKKTAAYSDEMKEFSFFDRRLMNETIIPFMNERTPILDKNGKPKKHICYSPQHLCELYKDDGVIAYTLDDVNSKEHLKYVKNDTSVLGALCMRGLQIFEQPIIDAYSDKSIPDSKGKGFLWNIHPGRLPDYRGLLPIFRAIADERKYIDWTLHAIEDETIDTGVVYDSSAQVVDPEKSILWHYSNSSTAVAAMVFKNIGDVLDIGVPRTKRTQDKREGKYFSYPSPEKIAAMKKQGGIWIGKPSEEKKMLLSAFANGSEHRRHLDAAVGDAISVEYNYPISAPRKNSSGRRPAGQQPSPHKGLKLLMTA